MLKISVIILAKNEENNILDCLESCSGIEERIVIDDFSDDRTLEIIKKYDPKIKVFKRKLDSDFSAQRNFALSKATNSWVFFLDADERLSENLIFEIKEKIEKDNFGAFFLKRADKLWGRELKYGEVGNIKLVRLAKKNAGFWEGNVHEVWNIKGQIGELENELIHFPHPTIREFLSEVNNYSGMRARQLLKEGRKSGLLSIVFYPLAKFFLNYLLKQGFRDEIPGLVVALMMSFHSFLVRGKLYMLQVGK